MAGASRCAAPPGGGPPQCLCGNTSQCGVGEACVLNDTGTYLCANLQSDPNNCGMPGTRCNTGETCTAGVCGCGGGAACASGMGCCAGACVDVSTSAENCGECGNACTAASPTCEAGSCVCPGAGRECVAPTNDFIGGSSLGESCCPGMGCVANQAGSEAAPSPSCVCNPCTAGEPFCAVSGPAGLPGLPACPG